MRFRMRPARRRDEGAVPVALEVAELLEHLGDPVEALRDLPGARADLPRQLVVLLLEPPPALGPPGVLLPFGAAVARVRPHRLAGLAELALHPLALRVRGVALRRSGVRARRCAGAGRRTRRSRRGGSASPPRTRPSTPPACAGSARGRPPLDRPGTARTRARGSASCVHGRTGRRGSPPCCTWA